MTVPWKAWKTKYGFFHASHRPLKIPQNRRDFHIPTAQACTAWKSGKPTTGFPLSHPVHAMTTTVLSLNRKTKRKEVGRYAASSFFMPLSLRSSGTDFMLILQLENAASWRTTSRYSPAPRPVMAMRAEFDGARHESPRSSRRYPGSRKKRSVRRRAGD